MKRELHTEADFDGLPVNGTRREHETECAELHVLDVAEILALKVSPPSMLVEGFIPSAGASLIFGAPKSNKTLVSVQIGIAVAGNQAVFDYYRVLEPGAVLMIEQDDPAGAASIQQILGLSPVPVEGIPFYLAPRLPFTFGLELIAWLENEIVTRKLRLVILDSYTALRGSRGSGTDIVKAEQHDLSMLDEMGKRTACAILIIHHDSKGSASLNWAQKAAGTFAMASSTEAQIHISRYADLDGNAPERLLRVQGRHLEGMEMVLRFRKDTLDHEHVMEGGAAVLYPLIRQIRNELGSQTFGPKELSQAIGISRATGGRYIERLYRADVLSKRGFGAYSLKDGAR